MHCLSPAATMNASMHVYTRTSVPPYLLAAAETFHGHTYLQPNAQLIDYSGPFLVRSLPPQMCVLHAPPSMRPLHV
jgi:hypothetical protein